MSPHLNPWSPVDEETRGSARLGKRAFGLGLSAVLVLAACSSDERAFGPPTATGGAAPSGGSGGKGDGGDGGAGEGGADGGAAGSGTGGDAPTDCETDDPHCACVDGEVVARDEDEDGAGTSLCVEAPGEDCDDANPNFVRDACGGCDEAFAGLVEGETCGPGASDDVNCGVVTCDGNTVSCGTSSPALRRCANPTTRELCQGAQWVTQLQCESSYSICHDGMCVECIPGTYHCGQVYVDGSYTYGATFCGPTGSWESSGVACSSTCTVDVGCTTAFHLRDADFEVVPVLPSPRQLDGEMGRPARDVLDLAVGIAFG